MESVLAFQIWYYKLCLKKLMKEKQKILFSFFFSLEFSRLNLSWKFEFFLPHFQSSSLLYFTIIFNNWRKSLIKLAFLSVSTIWLVKHCQKLAIFKFLFLFLFVIISYSLYSHPLPAHQMFLIVLNNGIKNIHMRKAWSVTWYRNRELHNPRKNRYKKLYWKLNNS